MVRTETPLCDFGNIAPDFSLPGIDGRDWTLADCRGPRGTLIMFICNHCPYVKAIQNKLVRDSNELLEHGIHSVAIMPNDPHDYPEDSFENMQAIAKDYGYNFPYLIDKSQQIAQNYGAVCTPDFFGYNANLELQYRGRLDASRAMLSNEEYRRDLFHAMVGIATTGQGPQNQIASMGCSIKWRHE
jgi:peroxiredoxin